jgi:subtilisin family serine protease
MKKKVAIFSCLLVFVLASAATAAWVDPLLEDRLLVADADEHVRAYVVLKDRVDVPELVARLDREGADRAQRHFEVITALQDKAEATQAPMRALLAGRQATGQVTAFHFFWIDNAFAVEASPEVFADLRERPDVARIFYDYEIELVEPVAEAPSSTVGKGIEFGVEFTRAPELWALGIDGASVHVADLDTGAHGSHPAFADRWRGLVADPAECWYDPAQSTTFPYDSGRHGTHTLGTMVGDDGGDNQIGMAPAAKWIAAAVVDVPGVSIYTHAVIAFEWCADPDGNPATMDDVPAVANNSWGISPGPFGGCDDTFWSAMDTAEAAGVAVVFAAGNEGPFARTLRSPADRITNQFNAFAVGALKQNGTAIARFSSRGPSRCDRATIKPEVSAVGEEVRSSIPDDGYTTMDGTSMAAPHVSGAIALLRDAFPDATVEELKTALYFTAVDMGDVGEDNTYGRGRIDVYAAYEFLLDDCDKDGDGYDDPTCGGDDCNDYEKNIHPGAPELCDGLDNDCNDVVPADETDPDEDGVSECAGDCAPNDGDVHPGHAEICDGKDNNCDDELPPEETDPDEDGVPYCAGDCAPYNGARYPGAEELCDGVDNDCDEQIPVDELDPDSDGIAACAGDCAPDNSEAYPGADEICDDGIDNDCDEAIDAADTDCPPVGDDDDDDDNNDNDDDTTPPTDDDDATPGADDDDDDNDSGSCGG